MKYTVRQTCKHQGHLFKRGDVVEIPVLDKYTKAMVLTRMIIPVSVKVNVPVKAETKIPVVDTVVLDEVPNITEDAQKATEDTEPTQKKKDKKWKGWGK